MDDREIIALYWDRSEDAISETAGKYGKYCHYIANNILRCDEDAQECVNDTYLRAWNAIPPKLPGNLRTFLGKITRNLALNRWEKQTSEKRGFGQIPLVLEELSQCVSQDDPEDKLLGAVVLRDLMDRFLSSLNRNERRIFVRRYWYMSPIKEIAAEYGMTESHVTVILFRTRRKLKLQLEKEGIAL